MDHKRVKQILRSKWLHRLLILLLIAGFMWQVFVVSIQYFSYKTTTAVSFVINHKIKSRASAICVRYMDVVDHERVRNETGIQLKSEGNLSSSLMMRELEDRQGRLTIEQIFKYTPDPGSVVKRCVVPDEYGSVDMETSDCSRHFVVDKYFTQTYICYRFIRTVSDDYPMEEITHSLTKSFLMHGIIFSDDFWRIAVVTAIIYDGGFPHVSRDYGVRLGVRVGTGSDPNANNYQLLSAHDVISIKLPKPYDTNCIPGGNHEYFTCRKACRMKLYANINRVPATEMLSQPYDRRPFSESDKRDARMHASMRSFDQSCRRECFFEWCNWDYSVTSVIPSRHPNESFVFSVNTPKQPDFRSRALPAMTFIEYFSFTMGCFGTWFGISFHSLDPRRVYRVRRVRTTFRVR